jgi:hypothetical protein
MGSFGGKETKEHISFYWFFNGENETIKKSLFVTNASAFIIKQIRERIILSFLEIRDVKDKKYHKIVNSPYENS